MQVFFIFQKVLFFGVFSPFFEYLWKRLFVVSLGLLCSWKEDIYVFQGHLYTIEEENK